MKISVRIAAFIIGVTTFSLPSLADCVECEQEAMHSPPAQIQQEVLTTSSDVNGHRGAQTVLHIRFLLRMLERKLGYAAGSLVKNTSYYMSQKNMYVPRYYSVAMVRSEDKEFICRVQRLTTTHVDFAEGTTILSVVISQHLQIPASIVHKIMTNGSCKPELLLFKEYLQCSNRTYNDIRILQATCATEASFRKALSSCSSSRFCR